MLQLNIADPFDNNTLSNIHQIRQGTNDKGD